jgi:hypothetical protein
MRQFLLSRHVEAGIECPQQSPERMQEFTGRINALEVDMEEQGAFVFTGGLHGPDAATVIRHAEGDLVTTDSPFVESKEQIGGLYVIETADLDQPLAWAGKAVDTTQVPNEVRTFFGSRSA